MSGPEPDPFETLFERGVTDGLPVVPPTRERVAAMVAGSGFAFNERGTHQFKGLPGDWRLLALTG